MSRENVKKFYELAETDKDFAQKLASLDSEMSLEASDLANLKDIVNEKIIPLATEKGLEFTAEEMVDFANEKYLQLSEDDLLDVSGGVSPKAAALGLSSVLMLSLGSAAAINLMNNNHDDVSHVVSEPSKTASEEKDESEDEEALKKSLDEMMKKSPKGADKNVNMEDIEKDLDKLFKGGKLGGGSAFRPGKGRTAGKNMLNRTIGKKGTSDFDFDKFLKELDNELAKEAPASQAAKPKATISETSNFDFDKFMEEINSEKKPETGASPLEAVKPAQTATSARIDETTKPAPISRGTPKIDKNKKENKKSKKVSEKKSNEQQYKKMAQQQVNKRLSEFKAKFETSFKEKFKTQCDDEDLKAFVQEYLTTPGNLDGGNRSKEIVEFYYGFSGGSVSDSVNVLDFAKELNAALPKMQYKPVSRGATTSWETRVSHVMGALQEAKYDLSKFDLDAMQKLQNDINWICGEMKASDGTYYLGASSLAGGYFRSKYGWNTTKPTLENKKLEFLQALKASNYNKDDEKVQAALKALSGDEIKETTVKKPDAIGEDQARRERERKEAEEKERLQVLANERADDFKKALIKDFKERVPTKVDDEALRLYAEDYLETHDNERDMYYLGMNVVFYATGSDGITENSSFDVLDVLREANNALPEKNSQDTIKSQEAAQQAVDDLVRNFKSAFEGIFNEKYKTQLSEAELQQFVSEITGAVKSDVDMQKTAIVGSNTITFFANGQLNDGTAVDASKTVNVFELAKELNEKLPKAEDEKPLENTTIFENQEDAQKKAKGSAASIESKIKDIFAAKNFKTKLSDEEVQRFINELNDDVFDGTVEDGFLPFVVKGQLPDGTPVEVPDKINLLELVNGLNATLPDAEAAKPQEKLKEKPVEKPTSGAKVTTAKELQKQAEAQKKEAETNLTKTFNKKVNNNNKGIELNEASLNGLINETLNSYKGKENITVNEKNGTITFTAKGVTKGWILTGDDSRSDTLNVRELFTNLNKKATEARRKSEREKFDHTKYIPATENDVKAGLKVARETAKEMIQEEFNKIIVEEYNKGTSDNKATSVADISAGRVASIVKSLGLDKVVADIVKANIDKANIVKVDDFKIKGAEERNGQFSIKIAPENKELKIGAIGYKGLTGFIGFRQPELIKYGDEISIREEVEKLIEETTVAYEKVTGQNADKEVEALYKFLTDNKLVENGTVVESVLDAIKDSDKEQFKKDVKHIANQISGSEDNYTLSGMLRKYDNVAQEKLKAIKDLERQLGV